MIALPPIGFIRTVVQVGIVVEDLDKALEGYAGKLGVGPWRVSTYAPPRLSGMKIRGVAQDYSMRIGLAWTQEMNWELIQPLEGPSIYKEFLRDHGEGLHHLMVDCGDLSIEEIAAGFAAQGWETIMEGNFMGNRFAYFGTEGDLTTTMEVRRAPADWQRPEPDSWYPAPPGR